MGITITNGLDSAARERLETIETRLAKIETRIAAHEMVIDGLVEVIEVMGRLAAEAGKYVKRMESGGGNGQDGQG